MRPGKAIADHSDRGLDLEKLWHQLDEEPPGEPKSLDVDAVDAAENPEKRIAPTTNQ